MISSNPPSAPLEVRVDGPCGTLILQRPARSNALSRELVGLLQEALRDLHQVGSLRGVILTGAGTMFSAGSDLHELQASLQGDEAERHWFQDASALRELFLAMLRFPRPIVAAVNGPALGSGLGLALACDLMLAAPGAVLGTPEALRGLTAGITIPLLNFRGGGSSAARLILGGSPISAAEAHRLGLVHEVVAQDFLWARGRQLIEQLAQAAPEAIAMNKRVLNEIVGETMLTSLTAAAASTATARTTENAREGIDAFVSKRPPRWL